jgi:hypothetical protein
LAKLEAVQGYGPEPDPVVIDQKVRNCESRVKEMRA